MTRSLLPLIGGMAAGFINTLASSGSATSLPILLSSSSWVFRLLVGIWAGLIVLDSCTYVLLTLVLAVGYDLVGANAMKAVTGIGFTIATIILFAGRAEVDWIAGGLMSVGAMAGAWLGAKLAASERSKVWVFRVLVVTIVGEIVHLGWR
jgi:uncharacterized membrane protein YfcA